MELLEEVAKAVEAANKADKDANCPFCPDKDLSKCERAKKNPPQKEVESKPDALGCGDLSFTGCTHAFATANHHLISAKQCYARLKRAVRMGSMANYDINDKKNGIPLPTIANNLTFQVGSKKATNYGALGDDEKKEVAFAVMEFAGAQWHVGHHRVEIERPHYAEEMEDAPWVRGHTVSYDSEVINQILKILSSYDPPENCDDTKPDQFKEDMEKLSKTIAEKLNEFGKGPGKDPTKSFPYYASRLAAQFANAKAATPVSPPKSPMAKSIKSR